MKSNLLIAILLCLAIGLAGQINLPGGNQILISVGVTGFVKHPGTYQLTLVNRVSDALQLAQGTQEKIQLTENALPNQLQRAEQDSLQQLSGYALNQAHPR
jgi:protein involved in polysaccharide export with SLBB domain